MNRLRVNLIRRSAVSRVFKSVYYTTEAPVAAAAAAKPQLRDSLQRRIMRTGDPRISMADVANEWVEEGKRVTITEFQHSLRILRKDRRCKHALQLFEWMIERMNYKQGNSDFAIRLDLIAKVRGLEKAEKFFEEIPEQSRDYRVYGALLSCYAHDKSVEKAEATIQRIRELGYTRKLTYNVMLNLYSQTKQYEKMDALMQEMEERGMEWDNYTYNTRLSAFASASDVEGMEKLLSKMESDPSIKMDWNSYVVVANGYSAVGVVDKALEMMRKAEQLTNVRDWKRTFAILITLHGRIGDKDELYRVWNAYKKKGKFDNTTYLAMLSSLVRLDDIAGAERIVEEWEQRKAFIDVRIPRFLISTYCKKGLLEKAEAYMDKLVETGEEVDARMWNALASGYESKKQMKKALEALKRALSVTKDGLMPNKFTLASLLDYLKEKGDVEEARELLLLLRKKGSLPVLVYETLLDYVSGDKDGNLKAISQLEDAQRRSGGLSSQWSSREDDYSD